MVVCAETNVVLGSRVLVANTLVAGEGPLFFTTTVKVTLLVAKTGIGVAVSETDKSAAGLTVVITEEELLDETMSGRAEEPVAVFVMDAAATGWTVMMTMAVALLTRVPMLQVTTPFVCVAVP